MGVLWGCYRRKSETERKMLASKDNLTNCTKFAVGGRGQREKEACEEESQRRRCIPGDWPAAGSCAAASGLLGAWEGNREVPSEVEVDSGLVEL